MDIRMMIQFQSGLVLGFQTVLNCLHSIKRLDIESFGLGIDYIVPDAKALFYNGSSNDRKSCLRGNGQCWVKGT